MRVLLVIELLNKLPARSIDFTLAFLQAELDVLVCMELPEGLKVPSQQPKEYIIELKRSLYVLKQASYN